MRLDKVFQLRLRVLHGWLEPKVLALLQGFLKEYILTSTAASGSSSTPPTQPQHLITQYKAIE